MDSGNTDSTFSPGQAVIIHSGVLRGLTGVLFQNVGDRGVMIQLAQGIYLRIHERSIESIAEQVDAT